MILVLFVIKKNYQTAELIFLKTVWSAHAGSIWRLNNCDWQFFFSVQEWHQSLLSIAGQSADVLHWVFRQLFSIGFGVKADI